jgi:hypothetical protein
MLGDWGILLADEFEELDEEFVPVALEFEFTVELERLVELFVVFTLVAFEVEDVLAAVVF